MFKRKPRRPVLQLPGDRKPLVAASLAAVAMIGLGVYQVASSRAASTTPSKAPFASTSFWNQKLPATTPLDPDSANKVVGLQAEITKYYNSVNVNTTKFSPPIYTVAAGVKTYKFGFYNCQNKSYTETKMLEQISAVPVPDYAVPAGGTDMEMVIYQPSTDTVWEMWKARKVDGNWEACWGGKIAGVSKSDGVFAFPFGTTATGLSLLGGTITFNDLKAGRIDHAIGIATVLPVRGYVWPANRNDGWTNVEHGMKEGTRLRLDPTIDVDSLKISSYAKMVAHAAQDYGFVMWDKAGSVSLRSENPVSITAQGGKDPYPVYFEGKANYQVMAGFPWGKLQVLPEGYGKPGAPTAAPTATTTPTKTIVPTFTPSPTKSQTPAVSPSKTPVPTATPGAIPGDLTGDGKVNALDLSKLLSSWGKAGGDTNGDGTTNVLDLSVLISNWRS